LKLSTKIGKETVYIDPIILFSRLVVLLERCEDIEEFFAYELAPIPTSLFKRKNDAQAK